MYLFSTLAVFVLSYFYYSSPGLLAWSFFNEKKTPTQQIQAVESPVPTVPVENPIAILKASYNQMTVGVQKAVALVEESRKVNVPGDTKRTSDNYRIVLRNTDALLAQFSIAPGAPAEVTAVLVPLKESLSLLGKSASIMADYLDGKLSLAPPNPDWVSRSQEYAAQGQVRLKEAQQALQVLRKRIE